jgi:hypothetical protein
MISHSAAPIAAPIQAVRTLISSQLCENKFAGADSHMLAWQHQFRLVRSLLAK